MAQIHEADPNTLKRPYARHSEQLIKEQGHRLLRCDCGEGCEGFIVTEYPDPDPQTRTPERAEFLADIISTTIEGGAVEYWAEWGDVTHGLDRDGSLAIVGFNIRPAVRRPGEPRYYVN